MFYHGQNYKISVHLNIILGTCRQTLLGNAVRPPSNTPMRQTRVITQGSQLSILAWRFLAMVVFMLPGIPALAQILLVDPATDQTAVTEFVEYYEDSSESLTI